MTAVTLRKGWCPGVLRPMPAGDGLLVRLRITGGELSAGLAQQIARLALRYGSGAIDLTQRANLQLRGLREETIRPLIDELTQLGLIDPSIAAEAVRNVMLSPLAGLDPACADGRAIARALEDRLRHDTSLHQLPGKFGFAIDGGGQWPLGDAGADVRLIASGADRPWRIQIGGAAVLSQAVPGADAVVAMVRVTQWFCERGLPRNMLRMRDLVAADGVTAVLASGGLRADMTCSAPAAKPATGRFSPSPNAVVVAIGLPFGRLEAGILDQLAGAAPDAMFRLTPWRMLCVVCTNEREAQSLERAAVAADLVTVPGDARLAIDACTGAPGCANATTPTRQDAAGLAISLKGKTPAYRTIHISGCAKGCAHRGRAPITFVANAGRYDLVLNGSPADQPVRTGISGADLAGVVVAQGGLS